MSEMEFKEVSKALGVAIPDRAAVV